MDDNTIIIEIDGQRFYVEAGRLHDLQYIDNKLVNVSNSSITLVSSYTTDASYPRITCSSMSQCRYYSGSGYNYSPVTSNYNQISNHSIYELGSYGLQSAILFAILLLTGVRLVWKR